VDIAEILTCETGWEDALRARVQTAGKLHPHSGIDFFAFQRRFWGAIPPFAIGRGFWDNWLISRARMLDAPVVDATKCLTAIHQNHGYSHHPDGESGVFSGAEIQRNYAMGGGLRHGCTLRDATHQLTSSGVSRRLIPFDLHRCLIVPFVKKKWARPFVRLKRALFQDADPATQKETP
jgi:hypothetical protein